MYWIIFTKDYMDFRGFGFLDSLQFFGWYDLNGNRILYE